MRHWTQLLVHEVQELHDAEKRLLDTLPELTEKASDPQLKSTFERHADETEQHVERLEEVARMLQVPPDVVSSRGMKGLIREAREILQTSGDPEVLDAALICTARKLELYEVAAYDSARILARDLGLDQIAGLLALNFGEKTAAHDRLAALADRPHGPA